MQVIEQERKTTPTGETVAVYQAGKRTVQLIGTFSDGVTLDDLLYSIACQKIVDTFDKPSTSL